MTSPSPLVFKYLALPNGLGGRGGVQRFFLLSQNIPFEEDLVPFSDWGLEKERLVTSKENPSGTVPVIYVTNSKDDSNKDGGTTISLVQHIAASRYLARVHGLTSRDDYQDYVQDLVADEYQGFRDQWVKIAFTGTNEDKTEYREKDLPKRLDKFEQLYAKFKTQKEYLSVSKSTGQPLWGDAAMFGLLYDHKTSGMLTLDELKASYINLWTMYEAYAKIPAVKDWMEKVAV